MNYSVQQANSPKNALILQGDWEGGISNVALDMISSGISVTKVILNAAEWIYVRRGVPTVSYDEPLDSFEPWLRKYIANSGTDCVILYNQYRPYNEIGWRIAKELNIQCIVLELGLLRPDFCTIYSRDFDHFDYLKSEWRKLEMNDVILEEQEVPPHLAMMKTMTKMKQFAAFFLFSRVMAIFGRQYTHYVDQRGQGFFHHFYALIKSGLRYQGRAKHSRYNQLFAQEWRDNFFLVPLQVHCDSQITKRSDFESIEDFIDSVVDSFIKNAPAGSKLVFKVHPMDRGYKDYHKKIKEINRIDGNKRIHYVDRVHLPTALNHCKGVVTINSSVGLSALIHRKKLICLGEAAFDLENLSYQGSLESFWNSDFVPSREKMRNFINLLKLTSQANGTFFQKIYSIKGHSKINWPTMFRKIFVDDLESIN